MTFPTPVLEAGFRMDGGPFATWYSWLDITDYMMQADVRYGRSDPTDRYQSATATIRLNNSDRRFDPFYEDSPYASTYLALAGSSSSYASSPDGAGVGPTGDMSIILKVAVNDWTPTSGGRVLISKWNETGNQRSYKLTLNADSTLTWQWSEDGAAGTVRTHSSPALTSVGAVDGQPLWLMVTLDVVNGANYTTRFYYQLEDRDDQFAAAGETGWWNVLGAVSAGPASTSVFNSTAEAQIGRAVTTTGFYWSGDVYYAAIHTGLVPSSSGWVEMDAGAGPTTATTLGIWTLHSATVTWVKTRVLPAVPIRLRADGYDLFTGFAEGWEHTFDGPTVAWTTLKAVDLLDAVNNVYLPDSAYHWTVLEDSPGAYWSLSESGGARANDKSGNDYHGTYRLPVSNTSSLVAGDTLPGKRFNNVNNGVHVQSASGARINVDASDWAVECWVNLPSQERLPALDADMTDQQIIFLQGGTLGTDDTICIFYLGRNGVEDPGKLVFHYRSSGVTYNQTSTARWCDGLTHHIVFGKRAGSTFVSLDDAALAVGALYSWTFNSTVNEFSVGGWITPTGTAVDFFGEVGHVALYPTGLSAARATEHYTVGTQAWAGDFAHERIDRILTDIVGLPAAQQIINQSLQVLQGTSFGPDTTALDYLRDVEMSEQGTLYVTPAGDLTFLSRAATAGAPTYNHSFADNPATAMPYTQQGFAYSVNPDGIINRVVITDDETKAVTIKEDADSIRRYGRQSRSLTRGMAADDAAITALADLILANYADPLVRFGAVTIDPRRTPKPGMTWTSADLWAGVLGLQIREGVMLFRTPQEVGDVIIKGCRVEGWTHTLSPGKWETTMTVSEVL